MENWCKLSVLCTNSFPRILHKIGYNLGIELWVHHMPGWLPRTPACKTQFSSNVQRPITLLEVPCKTSITSILLLNTLFFFIFSVPKTYYLLLLLYSLYFVSLSVCGPNETWNRQLKNHCFEMTGEWSTAGSFECRAGGSKKSPNRWQQKNRWQGGTCCLRTFQVLDSPKWVIRNGFA